MYPSCIPHLLHLLSPSTNHLQATGCPYYAAFCFALNGFNEFCGVDKVYYDQIARVPAFKCFRIRFQKIEIRILMVWPECAHPAITSILHTNPEEWARFKMLYAFLKTWCNLANADESGGQALSIVRHLELNRQLWEAYDTSDLERPPLDERVMAARNGVNGGGSGNRQGGAKLIQSSTYYAGWQ